MEIVHKSPFSDEALLELVGGHYTVSTKPASRDWSSGLVGQQVSWVWIESRDSSNNQRRVQRAETQDVRRKGNRNPGKVELGAGRSPQWASQAGGMRGLESRKMSRLLRWNQTRSACCGLYGGRARRHLPGPHSLFAGGLRWGRSQEPGCQVCGPRQPRSLPREGDSSDHVKTKKPTPGHAESRKREAQT